MKRKLLCFAITFTVPLFLFMNVLQAQKYMLHSFEVKGLLRSQERIVKKNKELINKVAELESPVRVVELLDSRAALRKIGGGEIVRIEVVE